MGVDRPQWIASTIAGGCLRGVGGSWRGDGWELARMGWDLARLWGWFWRGLRGWIGEDGVGFGEDGVGFGEDGVGCWRGVPGICNHHASTENMDGVGCWCGVPGICNHHASIYVHVHM